jgi:hypothetical protein
MIEILGQMYDTDSKYCVDCFFNMYYQFKKKIIMDQRCDYDIDTINRMWGAYNSYKYFTTEKNYTKDIAIKLAAEKHHVGKQLLFQIVSSFSGVRGSKKTKFKDLY